MTDKKEFDRSKDPALNDDSQPSVTTEKEAMRLADLNAGVTREEAKIPAPADAIDLAYRTAIADVDAQEVGKAVAAASESGTPAEDIDVESAGEGGKLETDAADVGTGPYEDRTAAQLKSLAASRGLPTSGSKEELAERLRG